MPSAELDFPYELSHFRAVEDRRKTSFAAYLEMVFSLGPVHTNAFSFENAYFFIHFRLPSTLTRSKTEVYVCENGGFQKRFLEWRYGRAKTEIFENVFKVMKTEVFENALVKTRPKPIRITEGDVRENITFLLNFIAIVSSR